MQWHMGIDKGVYGSVYGGVQGYVGVCSDIKVYRCMQGYISVHGGA